MRKITRSPFIYRAFRPISLNVKKLPVVMTESSLFISLPTGEASLAVGFWLPSLWGRGWGRGLYSGPNPIQLVVVMAVRAAVSAAITIFSAISMNLFFSFIFS